MSEEDVLRRIEARLSRLEAQSQPHAAAAGGAVVDPLPWRGGWGGWGGWGGGRPGPIVDPAVYTAAYRYQSPAIVDFVPWPWGPNVDPAVYAGAAQQAAATMAYRRPGPIMDPPPIDVSRFSVEQLEAALHSINAEKARLNSMETMLRQQLEKRQQSEG